MNKYTLALLVATFQILPLSLKACDCGDDGRVGIVHFKDGLTPNGPVPVDYGRGDTEGGCSCSSSFAFRDYGPVHAAPPPAPEPPHKPAS